MKWARDLVYVMWDEWCGYMGFCCYMLCIGIILQTLCVHTLHSSLYIEHDEEDERFDDRCGNSTTQSQVPDDGYINVRNMLST